MIYYLNFDKDHYKDFHSVQCTEHTPLALDNFQRFFSKCNEIFNGNIGNAIGYS